MLIARFSFAAVDARQGEGCAEAGGDPTTLVPLTLMSRYTRRRHAELRSADWSTKPVDKSVNNLRPRYGEPTQLLHFDDLPKI